MEVAGFYIFAAIAVVAALLVVTSRQPMYSVLLTVVVLVALAGLYVLLDAPFVAMVQIIIYAGAVMVLMLFTMMLLNAPREEPLAPELRRSFGATGARFVGVAIAGLILIEIAWAIRRLPGGNAAAVSPVGPATSVREIGRVLFTEYSFAFEATSVLILVALVGAIVLAHRER